MIFRFMTTSGYSGLSIKKLTPIFDKRKLSSKRSSKVVDKNAQVTQTHKHRLARFIHSNPKILELKDKIPIQLLSSKTKGNIDNMYLIDPDIAKNVATHITPIIKATEDHVICETNAGLGLVSAELLQNKVTRIKLYESCEQFRTYLQEFEIQFPGQVELFSKDLFQIFKENWADNLPMMVIGPLANINYLKAIMRNAFVNGTSLYGRMRLLLLMLPRDYVILRATPEDNLHTYQSWSVLSNLLFDIKLLEKYPRNAFLPWESAKMSSWTRFAKKYDPEHIYLVQIDVKETPPLSPKNLLTFFYFVNCLFKRGNERIIPTLEKFIPDCGTNLISPKVNTVDAFSKDIGIFTTFGDLTPTDILHLFEEVMNTTTSPVPWVPSTNSSIL